MLWACAMIHPRVVQPVSDRFFLTTEDKNASGGPSLTHYASRGTQDITPQTFTEDRNLNLMSWPATGGYQSGCAADAKIVFRRIKQHRARSQQALIWLHDQNAGL